MGRGSKAAKAAANAASAATGAAKAADAGSLPKWASGLTPVQYGAVLKGSQAYGLEPEAFLDLRNRAISAGATSEDFKKGRDHLMTVIAQSEASAAPPATAPGGEGAPHAFVQSPPALSQNADVTPQGNTLPAAPDRDAMISMLIRPKSKGGAGMQFAKASALSDADLRAKFDSLSGGSQPQASDPLVTNVQEDPATRPPSGENDTLPSTEGAVEAATQQAGRRGPGRPRKNPQAAATTPAAKPAAKQGAAQAKPDPADFSTVNWNQFQSGVRTNSPGDWSNLKAADFQKALNSGSPSPTTGTQPTPPAGGNVPPNPTDKAAPWYEQAGMRKPLVQSAAEHVYRNLPNYATLAALSYGANRLLNSGGEQQNEQVMSQAMPANMADEFLRQRGLMPPLQPNPADYGPSPEDRIRQMRGQ